MAELWSDRHRAAEYGAAARRHYDEGLRAERMVGSYHELYRRLIGELGKLPGN